MKVRRGEIRGNANAFAMFSLLVLATVWRSSIGLEGSIFNTLIFALIVGYLALNRRFLQPTLLRFFILPLVCVGLSLVMNLSTLTPGSINSALLIMAAYLLLAISGEPLNRALLQRLVKLYLIAGLVISIYLLTDDVQTVMELGNANFNVNPAAASQYFFLCLVLSLVFVTDTKKWLFVFGFLILVVTSFSRTGIVTSLIAIGGYHLAPILYSRRIKREMRRSRRVLKYSGIAALVAVVIVFAYYHEFITAIIDTLALRFSAGGASTDRQDFLWVVGVEHVLESMHNMLFGSGPATTTLITEVAVHSAYLDAAGSVGIPYVALSLLALGAWVGRTIRRGYVHAVWVLACILLDAIGTNGLFMGYTLLWTLLVLSSRYPTEYVADSVPRRKPGTSSGSHSVAPQP